MHPFYRTKDQERQYHHPLACRDVLRLGNSLDRAITEKGVLQLLFDLRFLRNSLAGGRPAAADAGPAANARLARSGVPSTAALSQRKRAFSDVESALQVGSAKPYAYCAMCAGSVWQLGCITLVCALCAPGPCIYTVHWFWLARNLACS